MNYRTGGSAKGTALAQDLCQQRIESVWSRVSIRGHAIFFVHCFITELLVGFRVRVQNFPNLVNGVSFATRLGVPAKFSNLSTHLAVFHEQHLRSSLIVKLCPVIPGIRLLKGLQMHSLSSQQLLHLAPQPIQNRVPGPWRQ